MADYYVNSDQTASTSSTLLADFSDLLDKLSKVRSEVSNLLANGYRTPAAQAQFVPFFEQYCKGFTDVANGLEGMAKYVKGVGDAFTQTDSDLGKSIAGR